MRRRVILQLAGAMLLAPGLACAQAKPVAKIPRVAFILTTSPPSEFVLPDPLNPGVRGFVHGLRDLGYVHGKNLILDIRSMEGKWERVEEFVADFIRLKADVIVVPSAPLVPRVAKLVTSIPIAMFGTSDLVGTELVQSLSRPRGNITGVTVDVGPDVESKRVEMLLEVLPRAKRVAYLGTREEWEGVPGQGAQSAAKRRGIAIFHAGATHSDFASALARIKKEKPSAFFVSPGPSSFGHRRLIGEFAAANGVPSACPWAELAEHGCLMSYGVNVPEMLRRLAGYVDKLLKGAKPADLPIEQPTKLELVINQKTARALGVSIPKTVLLRADRVIE